MAVGHRTDHDENHQAELRVGVVQPTHTARRPYQSGGPDEDAQQRQQFPVKNQHHSHQGAHMKADIKQQRRLVETEQFLKDHQMAGTAYRQKFGETLNHTQDNRFKPVQ